MNSRILIVEDEERIAEPLAKALQVRGFEAIVAQDALAARRLFDQADLILLDLNLPDADGLDLCREISARTDAPILIVSARGEVGDKVAGLEMGADDYVTKPFVVDELVARIRARLRRSDSPARPDEEPITIGDIKIEPAPRRAFKADDELDLSPKEFNLLLLLMRNAGRAVTREEAIDEVWDPNWYGSTKTLDVHIRWLRQKIEDEPARPVYISTIRGIGFRFTTVNELAGGTG